MAKWEKAKRKVASEKETLLGRRTERRLCRQPSVFGNSIHRKGKQVWNGKVLLMEGCEGKGKEKTMGPFHGRFTVSSA